MDFARLAIAVVLLTPALFANALGQISAADAVIFPVPGQTYVTLGGAMDAQSGLCGGPGRFCVDVKGINLNEFASEADLTRLGALTSQLGQVALEQTGTNSKLFDLAAVAAALKDAMPNDGDRFALRLNMGGFQGHLAAAVGASVNLNDSFRVSANFGQGERENMFSAGLNWSIH
jgi:YadA-like membrane anchor domain